MKNGCLSIRLIKMSELTYTFLRSFLALDFHGCSSMNFGLRVCAEY
jgi:hypothetical protein